MISEQDSEGLDLLWPTVTLRRTPPGADVANPALADHILAVEEDNRALTTDYRAGNFLTAEHPTVEWLRECVNRTAAEYFRQLKMAYAIDWTVDG